MTMCIIGPSESIMAKFTKFILFGLSPDMFRRIRVEARHQQISVGELVRKAIKHYMSGLRMQRIVTTSIDSMPQSSSPFYWTQAEQEHAASVLRQFREEDR
jgi:hypothetical protein